MRRVMMRVMRVMLDQKEISKIFTNFNDKHSLKKNIRENKTFKCSDCGTIFDRDINGARNILLKYLTENK